MIRMEGKTTGNSDGVVQLITLKPGSYNLKIAGAKGGAGCGDKSKPSCLGGFGATLNGDLLLNNESELIILPGNSGTDNTKTSGDGTTGAGGGGTYVALVVSEDHPGALLTSGFSNADCNNKYVIPLLVAAGGNGGRDYGYSGDGAVYHGVHTTYDSFKSGSNQGGSFDNLTSSITSNGSNFIRGGAAATSNYTRASSTSYAGFGGGGANKDDGEGGGGGGYYGGHNSLAACSYYNEEYISNFTGITGDNNGPGYIEIEKNTPPGPYNEVGEFEVDLSFLSSISGLDYIILSDVRIEPTNTSVVSKISTSKSQWDVITPNEPYYIPSNSNVKLKYELSSNDVNITPIVYDTNVLSIIKIDKRKVILKTNPYSMFNNVIGDLTVEYDETKGTLTGSNGELVSSFTSKFSPINLIPKPNPYFSEYINADIGLGRVKTTHVTGKYGYGTEYIEADVSMGSVSVRHIETQSTSVSEYLCATCGISEITINMNLEGVSGNE